MFKSRIVALALISIILSSSSISVADAYVIWSDDENTSLLMLPVNQQTYKINLLDQTDASLINRYDELSESHKISLRDGISASYVNGVYDNGKPYHISLSDGIAAFLVNYDNIFKKKYNDDNQKIITVGLTDGVGTDTTDYDEENSRIVLIKQTDDKKALWERIFPLDRIRNNIKSFYKIIQNDHSLSYIQMDEIDSKSYDYSLKQTPFDETTLEQMSEFEKFVEKSWYVADQIEIRAFNLLDVDKFINKSNFVGLQLVEHTQKLANPEKFLEKSKFVGQHITITLYHTVDPKNPTLLVLLIPLIGIVLIRTENEKIKFYHIQKIVSFIFAVILISSAVITPFSYSVLYWGYAFAEEETVGTPEEPGVDQIVETVEVDVEEITEPPPAELPSDEPILESPADLPLESPIEDLTIQNTTEVIIEEPIQTINNTAIDIPHLTNVTSNESFSNNQTISFDETITVHDNSTTSSYNNTTPVVEQIELSLDETFKLIDIISLNNQTQQINLSISLDETIVLTDAITSPNLPQNQSLPESLSFIDDIILLLQNQTSSLPNSTESWQFENDTDNVTFNDDAIISNTEGINGTSLLLDGQQDYAQTNSTNATTYITDMSIAAWVKPNYTNGSPEFTVVSKGKSFVLSINNIIEPQHVAKFAVFDGIKWTTVESKSTIPDNSWSHLTARFNKTSIALYVNGTLEGTVTHGGVPYVTEKGQIELKTVQKITSYHDIVIGAALKPNMDDRPYNMFSGLIDGVQLFDSRLGPEDIILLYQNTIPIKAPAPVPETRRSEPVLRYRIIKGNETLPISIPVDDLNNEINQITVSTWIRPNYTDGSPEFTILSRENSFILSLNKMVLPEHVAKFLVYDGISWHTVTGSTPIDGWTHVAATVNGSSISIYVNGTLDGKLETGPPAISGSTANVTIGAYENTLRGGAEWSNYYFGEIYDATVWEYAMVDREIEEEYWKTLLVYQPQNIPNIEISIHNTIRTNEYTSKSIDNSIPNISIETESLSIIDDLTLSLNQNKVNATILPQTLTFEDNLYLKLNDTSYTYLQESLLITEDILLLLNNQTVTLSNSTSRLAHGIIEIGKPVDWSQTVMLNGTDSLQNILVELPADAQNIQIQKTDENGTSTEIPEEEIIIIEPELEPVENQYDIPRPKDIDLNEIAKEHNAEHVVPLDQATLKNLDEVKQKDKPTVALLINETRINATENINPQNQTEYTVKFQTPAPYALENDYSTVEKYQKNVTIAHNSTLHYTDVKSYTDIPEYLSLHNTQFKLYWMINDTKVDVTHDQRFNVTFNDTDNNGAIDRMEWNVPQLSEQEFGVEADIVIINVQSYPIVGGNWTVNFNTTGTADLIIEGILGTTFGESLPDDLKFLELNNGTHTLTPSVNLTANTITYHNYTSNYTGFEASQVLTDGDHHLMFTFGNDVGFAHNNAKIFQDNFDRADSAIVDNGWTEVGEDVNHFTEIFSNTLRFTATDGTDIPLIKHTFEKQTTGKIKWTFTFDWAETGIQGDYEIRMQLGDSGLMNDTPNSAQTTGVAVNLLWGDLNRFTPAAAVDETFGRATVGNTVRTAQAVVSGQATITVIADLDAETYDLEITGPGFSSGTSAATGIPFDNNGLSGIDEVRIFADDLASNQFSPNEFDNMVIEKVNGDIQTAVGRFTLNAGVAPNTQSITGLGFEPKAYILMATKNNADNSNSGGSEAAGFSMGATDGKNSWAIATQDEEGVDPSDSGRRAASGYVLLNIDEDPSDDEIAAGIASHVSFDPDGFTIHIQDDFDENAGQLVEYIAFGGDGVHPAVGDVILDSTNGDPVSVSGLDFEPDLLITGFVGPWIGGRDDPLQEAMMMSLGWAVNPDIQATNNQFSMSIGSLDAQGTADSFSRFDDAWAGVSGENDGGGNPAMDSSFEITGFYNDGFTVTTRQEDTSTNPRVGFGYLALDLGDSPEIYTTSRDALQGAAGLDIESGAGFMPIFLLGAGSAEVSSAEINTIEDDASLAIGITNGTHSYSLSMRSEDEAGSSNTATRTRGFPAFLEAYPDNSDTLDYIADFDSFTGDGWILDYTNTAGADYQIAFLAIGDNYQRSVPDRIDFMQPDAAAPGMDVAVSFYGHNFNNTQQVTTSSNYIMVGPVYVFNEAGENVTSGGSILTTTFFVNSSAPAETVTVTIDGTDVIPKFEIIPITGTLVGSGDYSGFAPCPCPTFTLGDDNGINGNRTKLGTIILDDLKVPNGMTLQINVTDLDDSTPANEGFLPVVILVHGDVDIDGTIDISGSNGADGSDNGGAVLIGGDGGDGGPGGGGGGGGAVSDDNGGANDGSGGDGGTGYTGGGGGGCSDNEVNSIAGTGGMGTGGASVAGTDNCEATHGGGGFFANYTGGTGGGLNTFDASTNDAAGGGGGTGFVFGSSGKGGIGEGTANGLGSGAAGDGGGGGGDAGDNYAGGGGGFGQVGDRGENDNGNVHGGYGGRVYGNEWLVPVSGGSGGGGGGSDDDDTGDSSGGGGGGGGALIIYGTGSFLVDATGSIDATGGNGGNISSDTDDNGEGGGGSGGAIILQGHSVVDTQNGDLDANGGVGGDNGAADQGGNGGDGRVRVDGLRLGSIAVEGLPGGFSGSDYVGPAISGINILSGLAGGVYLNGTGKNNANVTAVIINDNNDDKVADFTDYYYYEPIFSNGKFGFPVTFREGVNFITVIQNTTNNNSILSSAATHIVIKITITDEAASIEDIVIKAPVNMKPYDAAVVDDVIRTTVTMIFDDSIFGYDYITLVMHIRDESASIDDIVIKAPVNMKPYDAAVVDDYISTFVTLNIADSASVDDVISWTLTRHVQDDTASIDDIVIKAPVNMKPYDAAVVDDYISTFVTLNIADSASVDDVITYRIIVYVQDDTASIDDIVIKAPVNMKPYDAAVVDDYISTFVTLNIADSASVDDVITYRIIVYVQDDTASIDDIVIKAPVNMKPYDAAVVDDYISTFVTLNIADSASVDDVISWTLTRHVQDDTASIDDIVIKAPVNMKPYDAAVVDDYISTFVTLNIADSASVDDVVISQITQTIQDSSMISDIIDWTLTRSISDSVLVNDLISFDATMRIKDEAMVEDQITATIVGLTIRNLNNSAVVDDFIVTRVTKQLLDKSTTENTISIKAINSISDSVLVDDFIKIYQIKSIFDLATVSDTITKRVTYELVDSALVDDSLRATATIALKDTALVNDSIRVTFGKIIQDSVLVSDTLRATSIKSLKDSALVDDSLRATATIALKDTALVNDSIRVTFGKIIQDSVLVSDTLRATSIKSLKDSALVDDSLRATATIALKDTALVNDSIRVTFGKIIQDSVLVSDTLRATSIKSLKDSALVDDSLRATATIALKDTALVNDSIRVTFGKIIQDSVLVSDTLRATSIKSLKDSALVDDSLRATATIALKDTALVNDSIRVTFGKIIQDSVLVSDTLRATSIKSLKDSALVDDSLRATATIALKDTALVNDSIRVTFGKIIQDSVLVSDTLRATSIKSLKDSALVDDSLQYALFFALKDTVTVDDTIRLTLIRPIFDSATVSDTLRATSIKALKDSALVDDSLQYALFFALKDTVTVDDTIRLTLIRPIFDSATVSDTLRATSIKALKDSALVDDSLRATATIALKDTVTVDDTIRLTLIRPIFDSATISDTLRATSIKALKDSALVDDSLRATATIALKDTVTVDDTIRLTLIRPIFDSATVSDTLRATSIKALKDSALVDDSLRATATIALKDTVTVDDTIRLTLIRPIFDSATVSDTLRATSIKALKDSALVDDSLRATATIALKDTVTVDDTIRLTLIRPIFDSATVSDTLRATSIKALKDSALVDDSLRATATIALKDTVTVDDTIRLTLIRPIFDSATISDTLRATSIKALKDSALVDDSLQYALFFALKDTVTVDDTIRLTLIRPIFDSATVSDTLRATSIKALKDSALVDDSLQYALFFALKDTVTVDDTIRLTLIRPIFDSATISDTLTKTAFYRLQDIAIVDDTISKIITIVVEDDMASVDDIITIAPVTYKLFENSFIDDRIRTNVTYRILDTVVTDDVLASTITKVFADTVLIENFIRFDTVRRFSDSVLVEDLPRFNATLTTQDSTTTNDVIFLKYVGGMRDTSSVDDSIKWILTRAIADSTLVKDSINLTLTKVFADTSSTSDHPSWTLTRVIEVDAAVIDDTIRWARVKTIADTSSVDDSINLTLTVVPPPPPPPIPFGQGPIRVGPTGVAGGAPDMPTARIHRVEYDVCDENIVRILAAHDSSSPPRIQLLTTKSGVIDATLSNNQPFANQNKVTLVDKYLFEAPLAPGESIFTIFAVDYHSNVQRTIVQTEGCEGVLVFVDDQIVLPHIFDIKYKTQNGTDIRPATDYHYITEGQDMTVSAIVESPIIPLGKAELFFTTLGTGQQKVISMDISPLRLPDLENVSIISGIIPANLLKGPAVEFWIRIVTEEGVIQESVHSIVGVKPEGYSGESSVEMDTIVIKAQGTVLKPTAYLTNEGDIPVYSEVSLVADGKKVYSIPVLLTPGQNIINLEWSIPKTGSSTSYKMQTLLDVYDKSYSTGMATLDTFVRTKIVSMSDQYTIVPATDELGNTIARPAMMYSSNEGDGAFRVIAPDGTCVIGSGCLVEESTLKHRGGIDSVLIDGHIYRVRYSGENSPLERFSITSLDSVLGEWRVEITDLENSEFLASAAEDVPIKVQYRAERSPMVTVGME